MKWEIAIDIYTLRYIKWITNKKNSSNINTHWDFILLRA